MKLIVPLVFACDAKEWAHERGIPEADACADFTAVLGHAVNDGVITATPDTALPVLRGHITALTSAGWTPRRVRTCCAACGWPATPTRIGPRWPNSVATLPGADERSTVADRAGSSSPRWSGTPATS